MNTESKLRVGFTVNVGGKQTKVDLVIDNDENYNSLTIADVEDIAKQIKKSLKLKTPSIEELNFHTKDEYDDEDWYIIENQDEEDEWELVSEDPEEEVEE